MTAYGDMKPNDDQLWMNSPGSVHRCGNNVGLKQSWNHKNVGQTIVNHPHVYHVIGWYKLYKPSKYGYHGCFMLVFSYKLSPCLIPEILIHWVFCFFPTPLPGGLTWSAGSIQGHSPRKGPQWLDMAGRKGPQGALGPGVKMKIYGGWLRNPVPVDRWAKSPWFWMGFKHPFGDAGFRWPIHSISATCRFNGTWWDI